MAVDYAKVLKTMHPTILWKGSGATYDRITWLGTAVPQSTLDSEMPIVEFMVEANKAKTRLIRGYTLLTQKGFMSTALGSPHWYPAAMENQVDLIGAVTTARLDSAIDFPFPCADLSTTPPTEGIVRHTDMQINQVMLDGASYKVTLFKALESQLHSIQNKTTIVELKSMVFTAP